ncbi:hypothetical protein ZOSMA_2G00130 [Zostera marina]|uniref:ELM2 domain-containing protein n=1 Tax=Zostera marina TaxID=29655 RepID=A0A0K9PAK4_ZOSMR|nr:hypothetical protein ZOSMA_2G00130 [Zostera marina]
MDRQSNSDMDVSFGSSGSVKSTGGHKAENPLVFDLNFPAEQYDFSNDGNLDVTQPDYAISKPSLQAEVMSEPLPVDLVLPELLLPLNSDEEKEVQNSSGNLLVDDQLESLSVEIVLARPSAEKEVEINSGNVVKDAQLVLPEKSKEELVDDAPVSLSDSLAHLKILATNSCFLMTSKMGKRNGQFMNLILNTRRALCPKVETKISKSLGFPYKEVRPEPLSWEHLSRIGYCYRIVKRTPIGPSYQVNLPIWTGSKSKQAELIYGKDSDSLKFLGTQLWPMPSANNVKNHELIGKGRDESCLCLQPRSSECIAYHKKMKNLELKSDLQGAYSSMGLDTVGEQVSESWTLNEQMEFEKIVKENPISEKKDFFSVAMKYFPKKTMKELVSYYHNVYVSRRMVLQNQLKPMEIDSEDDEFDGKIIKSLKKTPETKKKKRYGI